MSARVRLRVSVRVRMRVTVSENEAEPQLGTTVQSVHYVSSLTTKCIEWVVVSVSA